MINIYERKLNLYNGIVIMFNELKKKQTWDKWVKMWEILGKDQSFVARVMKWQQDATLKTLVNFHKKLSKYSPTPEHEEIVFPKSLGNGESEVVKEVYEEI